MLNRPALLIRNPDIVKKLLIKNFDHFNNRSVGAGVDHARVPNGTCGLLASQDDTWKWLRKTVTPAFSASQLKSTTSGIQNVTEKTVDFIRRSSDKISDINIRDEFVLDIP
ncbi:hypothetical protein WA026_006736 [Henosepilachna vigintioctopunctata]|uniref:Cytochrome P450 n=1 Tax=Henosepilachna vigintioctopunctata TaxID=420089 RepID=A0AAW1UF50_9CUCU